MKLLADALVIRQSVTQILVESTRHSAGHPHVVLMTLFLLRMHGIHRTLKGTIRNLR
jgi:hypothetical protein